jgi:hypothetical protein
VDGVSVLVFTCRGLSTTCKAPENEDTYLIVCSRHVGLSILSQRPSVRPHPLFLFQLHHVHQIHPPHPAPRASAHLATERRSQQRSPVARLFNVSTTSIKPPSDPHAPPYQRKRPFRFQLTCPSTKHNVPSSPSSPPFPQFNLQS